MRNEYAANLALDSRAAERAAVAARLGARRPAAVRRLTFWARVAALFI